MPQDSHYQKQLHYSLWRHTSHQYRICTEGRNRPAPSIGSPTLVWHIGVWRKRNHARGKGVARGNNVVHPHDYYIDEQEERNEQFYAEVFDFLHQLQMRGLCTSDPVQRFRLEPIAIEGLANNVFDPEVKPRRFHIFAAQSASFTIWWRDSAKNEVLNTPIQDSETEADQALRVFVQFQSFHDHFTLTFYIDAAKLLSGKELHKREEVRSYLGERRTRIVDQLDVIRRSCHEEVVSGAIELPSAHAYTNTKEAAALKTAADFLFDGIWKDFQSAFGFTARSQDARPPEDGTPFLDHGLIFINQRGLTMAIRGLDTEDDEDRAKQIKALGERNLINLQIEEKAEDKPWRQLARSASATLGPVDVFDTKCGEPEVVLKSLWPFLSQMNEDAGRKDWVGCGILDWRALFVSTLGSKVQPPRQDGTESIPTYLRTLPPQRFLIVTKGEPHRRQIGRMVERLVSLETMRAIAFKNLGTIQNASLHLRTLTMSLDDILEQWAADRKAIQEPWHAVRRTLPKDRKRGDVLEPPPPAYIHAEEHFYDQLSELNAEYEKQLIDIAASLERIGPGGSGHLAHSIDEAAYFIGEFDRMVPSLEIGNIAGWVNYAQFADRGMRPTFSMIKNTGQRLAAAQERQKALTDIVQVSALIVQSDATRRNTDTLRQIASNLQLLNNPALRIRGFLGPFLFALLFIVVYYAGAIKLLEPIVNWIVERLPW
jgi:hypothetical protein